MTKQTSSNKTDENSLVNKDENAHPLEITAPQISTNKSEKNTSSYDKHIGEMLQLELFFKNTEIDY